MPSTGFQYYKCGSLLDRQTWWSRVTNVGPVRHRAPSTALNCASPLTGMVDLDGRVARPYQPDLRRTCEPCDHHRVLQLRAIVAIPGSAAHPRRHDSGRRLRTSPVRHRVRGRGPCHSYARHGERRAHGAIHEI